MITGTIQKLMAQVQTFDNENLPARRNSAQASSWDQFNGKRIFELAAASLVLVAASPLMLFVAAIVKCSSRDPMSENEEEILRDVSPEELVQSILPVFSPKKPS